MKLHFHGSFLAASAFFLLCGGSISAQNSKQANEEARSFSWAVQDSGTTAGLRGIYSVDGKIAWASGTDGTVLKTADSGGQWRRCAVLGTDGERLDLRGVQAWDALTAVVMASGPGDKSRLYKTIDGCKSWTLLFKNPDSPDGFFDSFWIDSSGRGFLLGDPVRGLFTVFRTRDKGLHWQRELRGDLNVGTVDLGAFAASNGSILHGVSDHGPALGIPKFFAAGGKAGSFVFVRSPGLCTAEIARNNPEECDKPEYSEWKEITVPIASGSASAGIFALGLHQNFANRWKTTAEQEQIGFHQVIVAVGGDYAKPNEAVATAAWSEDEGMTWTAAAKPPHGYRSSVAWSQELKAWVAVGTNGSDISRDDGKTWTALDDGDWNALSLPFVVGPKGRIARLSVAAAK
jgi:photosystem II stability/assembly factor-like uncharacterized protein